MSSACSPSPPIKNSFFKIIKPFSELQSQSDTFCWTLTCLPLLLGPASGQPNAISIFWTDCLSRWLFWEFPTYRPSSLVFFARCSLTLSHPAAGQRQWQAAVAVVRVLQPCNFESSVSSQSCGALEHLSTLLGCPHPSVVPRA